MNTTQENKKWVPNELPSKEQSTQTGGRNLIFNNCTVTINEEGKAVEVLQAKQKVEEKQADMLAAISNAIGKTAESFLEERKGVNLALEGKLNKAKASVKKPVAKKQVAKKTTKKKK